MSKFKIILHIGRHKTGTTAFQKFCLKNRSLLNKYGYDYPNIYIKGPAHHGISEMFFGNSFNKFNNNEINKFIK